MSVSRRYLMHGSRSCIHVAPPAFSWLLQAVGVAVGPFLGGLAAACRCGPAAAALPCGAAVSAAACSGPTTAPTPSATSMVCSHGVTTLPIDRDRRGEDPNGPVAAVASGCRQRLFGHGLL